MDSELAWNGKGEGKGKDPPGQKELWGREGSCLCITTEKRSLWLVVSFRDTGRARLYMVLLVFQGF